MTSIIKADDGVISGVTGITSSADNSGTLELQAISGLVNMNNVTGALAVPKGTTAQRPSSPITGQQRWNTTTASMEFYNGSSWTNTWTFSYAVDMIIVAGGGGGGGYGQAGGGGAGGAGGAMSTGFVTGGGGSISGTVGSSCGRCNTPVMPPIPTPPIAAIPAVWPRP